MIDLEKNIHFVGIGGIGMSGLAKILLENGFRITGSDLSVESKVVSDLLKLGATIYNGHSEKNILDSKMLIRSSMIQTENPEILYAQKNGIPILHRSELLAKIMNNKFGIAISGMHGKTTTTSLVAHIFLHANYDPTVITGGIMKNINTNAKSGKSNYVIAEADESDKSLLNLSAQIGLITNLDAEHLDIYKDLDDVEQTLRKFLLNIPKIVLCADDENSFSLIQEFKSKTITYGIYKNADIFGEIKTIEKDYSIFEVRSKDESLGKIHLNIPGIHNVQNALGAIAVALLCNIHFSDIQKSLSTFLGVERRFDFKGKFRGAEIYDDYGHHPAEIENMFKIARKKSSGRLIVAFQLHRYSRTQKLWKDFIKVLSNTDADILFMTDIFPAGEQPIENICTKNMVDEIKIQNPKINIKYCQSIEQLKLELLSLLEDKDLLLTLGAGKLDILAQELAAKS